jgi:hypothetical protein
MRNRLPVFIHRNERKAIDQIVARERQFPDSDLPNWVTPDWWSKPQCAYSEQVHLFDYDIRKYARFYRDCLAATDSFMCERRFCESPAERIKISQLPWVRKIEAGNDLFKVRYGKCAANYWDAEKKRRCIQTVPLVRLTDEKGIWVELINDNGDEKYPKYWRLKILWLVGNERNENENKAFPTLRFIENLYELLINKAKFDCVYGYPIEGGFQNEQRQTYQTPKPWRTKHRGMIRSSYGNMKVNRLTEFFIKSRRFYCAPDFVTEKLNRLMVMMASQSFLQQLLDADRRLIPFFNYCFEHGR